MSRSFDGPVEKPRAGLRTKPSVLPQSSWCPVLPQGRDRTSQRGTLLRWASTTSASRSGEQVVGPDRTDAVDAGAFPRIWPSVRAALSDRQSSRPAGTFALTPILASSSRRRGSTKVHALEDLAVESNEQIGQYPGRPACRFSGPQARHTVLPGPLASIPRSWSVRRRPRHAPERQESGYPATRPAVARARGPRPRRRPSSALDEDDDQSLVGELLVAAP